MFRQAVTVTGIEEIILSRGIFPKTLFSDNNKEKEDS